MSYRPTWHLLALALTALPSLAACSSSNNKEPAVASSAGQSNYAVRYPSALDGVRTDYGTKRQDAHTLTGNFARYPDELSGASAEDVWPVLQGADEAGRSGSYVQERRSLEQVRTFFNEEKDEIGRKVAGSAQYVAQQKGCSNVEVGGAANAALKDAVDKRIEKRLREHNEGHAALEKVRHKLGKDKADKLEKQADEVAEASYLVHVALPEVKAKLNAQLAEANDVKKTLDASLTSEAQFQATPGVTEGDKKASNDRVTALNKAKGEIDSVVAQGQELSKRIDADMKEAQKEYADAFAALKARWQQAPAAGAQKQASR
ncbi:MAG TPA: hypothetical protein VFS43_13570 [Polyangiaceae bacterium]|nr:hypothetical protein [Polyangiaceae bacterium]